MKLIKKIKRKARVIVEELLKRCRLVRIDKGYLHTGHQCPKFDYGIIPQIKGCANVGIVIQGPIDRNDEFTINTIRLLRHVYPDVRLVLSTWLQELNEEDRTELEALKCDIIESESLEGEYKGEGRRIGHLNNQLYSSIVGIRKIKEYDVDFVLKMRTDTRIYKYDFIPYCLNLLSLFPSASKNQKMRLLNINSLNTLASLPFYMSDFIWFGTIEDMEKLYSIPNRNVKIISELSDDQFEKYTAKFWERANTYNRYDTDWLKTTSEDLNIFYNSTSEAYIMHQYAIMNELCDDSKNPLSEYYRFLRDNVIVVDEDEMVVYWDKYNYSENKNYYSTSLMRMTHSMWLDIVLEK